MALHEPRRVRAARPPRFRARRVRGRAAGVPGVHLAPRPHRRRPGLRVPARREPPAGDGHHPQLRRGGPARAARRRRGADRRRAAADQEEDADWGEGDHPVPQPAPRHQRPARRGRPGVPGLLRPDRRAAVARRVDEDAVALRGPAHLRRGRGQVRVRLRRERRLPVEHPEQAGQPLPVGQRGREPGDPRRRPVEQPGDRHLRQRPAADLRLHPADHRAAADPLHLLAEGEEPAAEQPGDQEPGAGDGGRGHPGAAYAGRGAGDLRPVQPADDQHLRRLRHAGRTPTGR